MGPRSSNDLEMAPLDNAHTPHEQRGSTQGDYDDDADDGDAGDRPLLSEETQARWREKTPLNAATFWRQTSGIVVEVSPSSHRSTFPDPRILDTANAPLHYDG
jgi:hypothetical protein